MLGPVCMVKNLILFYLVTFNDVITLLAVPITGHYRFRSPVTTIYTSFCIAHVFETMATIIY